MNVLALDTASPEPAVSWMADTLLFEQLLTSERHAAEDVLAVLESCLVRSGVSLESCDRIAVCSGPGSFTGIRIGLATAWGLSRALSIPVEPVSTLEALAESARAPGRTRVVAALDAGRGDVVFSRFDLDGARARELDPGLERLPREDTLRAVASWDVVCLPAELLSPRRTLDRRILATALARSVARAPREAQGAARAIYARPSAAEEKLGAP